jgi:O-antigen/teichoic acid export membrane protein
MLAASFGPMLVQAKQTRGADYEWRMQRFFQLTVGSAWIVAVVGALLAPAISVLAFGPAFAGMASTLAWLTLTIVPVALGVARHEYLVNEGRLRFQMVTTLVGAVTNVGLNFWLIPRWGALGAAWATLACHLVADLLLSFCWPPVRQVARWQLRALFFLWKPTPFGGTG